jgi:L-malate glycosyltransferase
VFRHALHQSSFDVIHVHYPHPYSLFLEDIRSYPLVVSTWGSEIVPMVAESDADKEKKVSILRRANRVVALSKFLAKATGDYAAIDPKKIVMHYWGVDLAQFSPRGKRSDDPVIGFTKGLSRQYGAEYLVDALPIVLKRVPKARVLMIGGGELTAAIRERAYHLGVSKSIEWLGPIDHSVIADYYARMTLSVMPSAYPSETLGLSALESQAMAIPVVASRIGGIPESVVDGETGILVPPRDPEALAAAILELLSSRDLRDQMGRHGRMHVERHFDWRCTLEKMTALYRDLTSS